LKKLNHNKKSIGRQELLEKLKSHESIKEPYSRGAREFGFTVGGKEFRIEWWINVSYLKTQCNCTIPFNDLEISGSWPNASKKNMYFKYYGEACCILPVEAWEKV